MSIAPKALLLALLCSACSQVSTIPGTKIPDTKLNREVIDRVEEYRVAMEKRDAAKLLSMAHPTYSEDSGTPTGSDDYGYPGLKRVLDRIMTSSHAIRYAIQFRRVVADETRATVDLRFDISYQIATDMGDKWERRQNDKRLELVYDGDPKKRDGRWMFLSGF